MTNKRVPREPKGCPTPGACSCVDAAPAVSALEAQRIRIGVAQLRAERDALKAALRRHAVVKYDVAHIYGGTCLECKSLWRQGEPERHAAGCLAAPEDAP